MSSPLPKTTGLWVRHVVEKIEPPPTVIGNPTCAQATHGKTPACERESSIEANSFLQRVEAQKK